MVYSIDMAKMKLYRQTGKRVKRYRKEAGLTQEALALFVGKSRSLVAQWERGSAIPTIHVLPRLAAALNKDIGDIIK